MWTFQIHPLGVLKLGQAYDLPEVSASFVPPDMQDFLDGLKRTLTFSAYQRSIFFVRLDTLVRALLGITLRSGGACGAVFLAADLGGRPLRFGPSRSAITASILSLSSMSNSTVLFIMPPILPESASLFSFGGRIEKKS